MRYPVTYSRLLARELRLDENGQCRLLAGTGLSPSDLMTLDLLISAEQQARIGRNAMQLANRPTFALEVSSRLSVAAHGPLGQLLSSSSTLGEAWEALERFHALRVPLVQLKRRFTENALDICLELHMPSDDLGQFLIEAMVVTVQRGIELVIGRKLREATYYFAGAAPAHVGEYPRFLHSPCHFLSGENRVSIPLALLSQPNPFRDKTVYQQALAQCEQLEQEIRSEQQPDWSPRILHLLRQHPGKLWTLAELAEHFHVSARTLIRYLKAEGVSYQELLDRELARQALDLLKLERHTVESVALALGYQDATAFRRAFKRWFGVPPSEYVRPG